MQTRVDEIADRIYRLSTFIPEVAAPRGFTFNQFLIDADEPLLFHTGMRPLFPFVLGAVKKVIDPARLRWIAFSHFEGDECGSLNEWLAAAPNATAAQSALGCDLTLNDAAAKKPRGLVDGEVLDIGGAKLRHLATPHVPHNVDAGLLFDETSETLFCSDLFAHVGDDAAVREDDVLEPAIEVDRLFPFTPATPETGPSLRRLASLEPRLLAIMHGAAYRGDARRMLNGLADYYDRRLRAHMPATA